MTINKHLEVSKSLKYLLVTSENVNEADRLLQEEFPNCTNYSIKMEILNENFNFSLAGRFTRETEPDKIAREDYFATLQYLISEAKDFGIKSVVRN